MQIVWFCAPLGSAAFGTRPALLRHPRGVLAAAAGVAA